MDAVLQEVLRVVGDTARELAGRLPRAELRLIENGGHSATAPAMAAALRQAADDLRGAV
jgi:hypothetical protein